MQYSRYSGKLGYYNFIHLERKKLLYVVILPLLIFAKIKMQRIEQNKNKKKMMFLESHVNASYLSVLTRFQQRPKL